MTKTFFKKIKLIQIVLLLLLTFFTANIFAQNRTTIIDLEEEDIYDEFDIFGDSLNDYSVYFTGENHEFGSFNTRFQYKMLIYLHQTQNVKHLIIEQSPGLSYIINKVVIDNKDSHQNYFEDIFFDPFYDLIDKLHDYNKPLPIEDKIKTHGIDIERFPAFSVYALNLMVDTLENRGVGGEIFEQIQALATSEYKNKGPSAFYANTEEENSGFGFGEVSAWKSLESIIQGSYANEDTLKNILGQDSTLYFSIIESIEIGHEWYILEDEGDVKSPIIRERFMANEFERVYTKYPKDKYYGQFGRCHLHKDPKADCYDYYMNSIGNRINEINPSLENQVLVIPIFYTKNKDLDKDIISDLELDEEYTKSTDSYIIDLAYKNEQYSITGFYDKLPFIILCNDKKDSEKEGYYWETNIESVHLGVSVGQTFFNKMSKLNGALTANNIQPFSTQFLTYSFYADYVSIKDRITSLAYIYYPEVSNGDRFNMKGFMITSGGGYPIGNKWAFTNFGLDFGYGVMKLVETQVAPTNPNLIQLNNANKSVYKNDIFTIDPNLQMRLTLPIISLNAKAGYAFDISGKYWKLDGKAKDFTKTSFSAPYFLLGASFNFKL